MLALDCGNSALKCLINSHVTTFYLNAASFDEQLAQYLQPINKDIKVVFSSVANTSVSGRILDILQRHFTHTPITAKTEIVFNNLKNGYTDFKQLGVDRWLAMIATNPSAENRIIIDAGSWITMDAISKDGQHLGGAIISQHKSDEALLLKRFNLAHQANAHHLQFGLSTQQCISMVKGRYGVHTVISLLSLWINHIAQPCRLFITGGDAKEIKKAITLQLPPDLLKSILDIQQNKNLVLSGLSIRYAEKQD